MSEALAYKADEEITYNLIPTIKAFHECPAPIRGIVGPVGCYSGDTEFLTLSGWMRFDSPLCADFEAMHVAQWDPYTSYAGTVSFTRPFAYIKEPCNEFIHFHNNTFLSMMLSEEHRMPCREVDVEVGSTSFQVRTAAEMEKFDMMRFVPVLHFIGGQEHTSKIDFLALNSDTCDAERVPSEDGFKYCFTVPTSFLVVRHNGRVFISGNSGKTTAAAWEICHFLPYFCYETYGIKRTRWVVVRNTTPELRDTTLATFTEWFGFGKYRVQAMIMELAYPMPNGDVIKVEILFRACDNEKHVRQFKSLEITGYMIDEAIEVSDSTKRMLKNRIGRYPRKSPVRFGIEITNPPDIEHTMYSQFTWTTPPPGPLPVGKPLKGHVGFWQPPLENIANLREGYYEDIREDYADSPDWADMYIDGKPGQLIRGKLVYKNFKRLIHVAEEPLIWGGQALYRGWDNSGNTPACVVVCPVSPQRLHIFKEFHTKRENIVEFTDRVVENCNVSFPDATFVDYGDPAGEQTYSTREGDFTSNAGLQAAECGVVVVPSQQNVAVRVNAVDQALLRRDGVLIDPRCTRLINGWLGGYHYPELRGMPDVYKKEVEKNKYSHVHDALQYVCVMLYVSSSPPVSEDEIYPEVYEETY